MNKELISKAIDEIIKMIQDNLDDTNYICEIITYICDWMPEFKGMKSEITSFVSKNKPTSARHREFYKHKYYSKPVKKDTKWWNYFLGENTHCEINTQKILFLEKLKEGVIYEI